MVEEFLVDLKKEFREENNEIIKITELKRIEQKSRIIEEFVQKFRRVVRSSGYKERLLVEKFKREINKMIRRKLIEAERPSRSINQQYKRAVNLNKCQKKSRRKKKIKKKKRDRSSSFKTICTSKHQQNTKTTTILFLSLAKKTRNLTVDTDKVYFNKKNKENQYNYG